MTQSPARYNWQGSASYVTGAHNLKVGAQYQRGTFYHTYDANGDLYQVYRSSATGIPFSVPDAVVIRNTPLTRYGERLNYDIGVYAQDTWTINRLTVSAGLRYEALNAQVEAAETPAGRFVPARKFDTIENLPNWRNWSPRLSAVYDLFGNSKTALKYSLNRYNQARTTGIAQDYNPLQTQTATLRWQDLNGDNIAQGGVSYLPNGTRQLCTLGVDGCELSGTIPAAFGTASLNTFTGFPRTWNLEQGVEIQHELLPRLSVTGSWFHGAFRNLTTTINESLRSSGDPLANPNYQPYTVYNPLSGEAITVYGRTATASSNVQNTIAVDSTRDQVYNAYNMEFRLRPGNGAQIFGGFAFERQLQSNCNVPDNPNNVRFCDDENNNVPFSKQFKVSGSYPLPWGDAVQRLVPDHAGPVGHVRLHQREPRDHAVHADHPRHHALSRELPVALPGWPGDPALQFPGRSALSDAALCAADAGERVLHPAHQPARPAPVEELQGEPLHGFADPRDVQPEQLERDDQRGHQQRAEPVVPLRQLDHAAAHARCRCAGEVVNLMGMSERSD